MISERCLPMKRPNSPAMMQPSSGRKTIAAYIVVGSALHQVDVFDRDGAAVAEIDDENGEADGGFGRGHGQHEEREHLAREVAQERGERDEVDVDGEQDQLDRHQDDDDVLAVDEYAEDTDREQERGDDKVVRETYNHSVRSVGTPPTRTAFA